MGSVFRIRLWELCVKVAWLGLVYSRQSGLAEQNMQITTSFLVNSEKCGLIKKRKIHGGQTTVQCCGFRTANFWIYTQKEFEVTKIFFFLIILVTFAKKNYFIWQHTDTVYVCGDATVSVRIWHLSLWAHLAHYCESAIL